MRARTGWQRFVAALALATAACAADDDDGPNEPDASASPDAGADGGAADSGTDEGRDAGLDAAPDAGPDVRDLLAAIEGLTATDRGNAGGDYRFFDLVLAQPIDHSAPERATFEQHLTLLHRSVEAPMLLVSTGYDNYLRDRLEDIALRLSANQLVVEKRYHGASRPDDIDWTTLKVDQISGDLHRIVEALGTVYTGPWVGTGRSMGGADSIYHRLVYGELDPWSASRPDLSGPSDVEAFVAPGENHDAHIADLEPEDRDAVLDRLEEWTGAAVGR